MRYVKFFQKLRNSKSTPVQLLANVLFRDVRSITGKNLHLIESKYGLDPWTASEESVRKALKKNPVPDQDMWRLPLLCQFIMKRQDMEVILESTEDITNLINSLCSS